jgi:two-component system nitrate/nitrite response regulator NarL
MEFTRDNPITLIIADDHEIVRTGIKRMLSIDKSLDILDEAENGEMAVELVDKHDPDVALLDIQMPRMDGIDAAKKIKKAGKGTFVVMLTAYEDSKHLEKALSAGADAYLSKDIGVRELIESIKSVVRGERVFSKSIVKIMHKSYVPSEEYDSTPLTVTKREQEILNLIALGKTSQKIADELTISVRTVESHRYNLMQKLELDNAAGLVRYAVLNTNTSR